MQSPSQQPALVLENISPTSNSTNPTQRAQTDSQVDLDGQLTLQQLQQLAPKREIKRRTSVLLDISIPNNVEDGKTKFTAVKTLDGVVKIPTLHLEPILKSREEEYREELQLAGRKSSSTGIGFDEQNIIEDFRSTMKKKWSCMLVYDKEPKYGWFKELNIFLLNLHTHGLQHWMMWWLEAIVRFIVLIQLLSLVFNSDLPSWGNVTQSIIYYLNVIFGTKVLSRRTANLLPVLFHFGVCVTALMVVLGIICWRIAQYPIIKIGRGLFQEGAYLLLSLLIYILPALIAPVSTGFSFVLTQVSHDSSVQAWIYFVFCLICTITFLAFTIFYTLAYYDWKPPNEIYLSMLGRAHARFDLCIALVAFLLPLLNHIFIRISHIVIVSLNFAIITILTCAFLYYMPYYRLYINRFSCMGYLWLLSGAIIAFFTGIFNVGAKSEVPLLVWIGMIIPAVGFGFFIPSLRIDIISIKVKTRSIVEYEKTFLTAIDAEVASRCAVWNADDIQYFAKAYELNSRFFQKSSYYFISWATFIATYLQDPIWALSILDKIGRAYISPDMLMSYLVRRQYWREFLEMFSHEDAQELALEKTKQYDAEARKLLLTMWNLLAREDAPKEYFMPHLIQSFERAANTANRLYRSILRYKPSARAYAKFLKDVMNDADTAEKLLLRADELESDKNKIVHHNSLWSQGPNKASLQTPNQHSIDNHGEKELSIFQKSQQSSFKFGHYGVSPPNEIESHDSDDDASESTLELDFLPEKPGRRKVASARLSTDVKREKWVASFPTRFSAPAGHLKKLTDHLNLALDLKKITKPSGNVDEKKAPLWISVRSEKIDSPITIQSPKTNRQPNNDEDTSSDEREEEISESDKDSDIGSISEPNSLFGDDEYTYSSLGSEDEVEDNIGAQEQLNNKVTIRNILQRSKQWNFSLVITVIYLIVVILVLSCFILVFVDFELFTSQTQLMISAGNAAQLAQQVGSYARTKAYFHENGNIEQFLNATESLKSASEQLVSYLVKILTNKTLQVNEMYYRSLQLSRDHCGWTCTNFETVYNKWTSESTHVLHYNSYQAKYANLSISLRDSMLMYSKSAVQYSLTTDTVQNNDFKFIIDNNLQQNLYQAYNDLQDTFQMVGYTKYHIIGALSGLVIIGILLPYIPLFIAFFNMESRRMQILHLFDVLDTRLVNNVYLRMKGRESLKEDNHRQRAAQYLADFDAAKSMTFSRWKSTLIKRLILFTIILSILIIVFLLALWGIYGAYTYVNSFASADLRYSGQRSATASRIRFLLQELSYSNAVNVSTELKTQITTFETVHRSLRIGNTSLNLRGSDGRSMALDTLYDIPRCERQSEFVCMSLQSLLLWYTTQASDITAASGNVSPSVIGNISRAEEELVPLLKQSSELYAEYGIYAVDTLINVLGIILALFPPAIVLAYFGFLKPALKTIINENMISTRMLLVIPLQIITSNAEVRNYLFGKHVDTKTKSTTLVKPKPLIGQQHVEKKLQEQKEFMQILLNTCLSPIIQFKKSKSSLTIVAINRAAMFMFGCGSLEALNGRPVSVLFPNQKRQLDEIVKSVDMLEYDDKLSTIPQHVSMKGMNSAGKEFQVEATVCLQKSTPLTVQFTATYVEGEKRFIVSLQETSNVLNQIIKNKDLVIEKLMYENLPLAFQKRLQAGEQNVHQKFKFITVVYIDLAKFGSLMDQMLPKEAISLMEQVFVLFDKLALIYQMRKVRTLGNSYICICDLFDFSDQFNEENETVNALNFALMALRKLKKFANHLNIPLKVKIGIHTGPAIAIASSESCNTEEGLQRRYHLDLHGEAISMAHELQRECEPNRIHVSMNTHARAYNKFEFESRGQINLGTKGKQYTYYMTKKIVPVIKEDKEDEKQPQVHVTDDTESDFSFHDCDVTDTGSDLSHVEKYDL